MALRLLLKLSSALLLDAKPHTRAIKSPSLDDSETVVTTTSTVIQLAPLPPVPHPPPPSPPQPANAPTLPNDPTPKHLASTLFSQNSPWAHPEDWTMPPKHDLLAFFAPALANAILTSRTRREHRCFYALVLAEAERYLNRSHGAETIDLAHDYPRNAAHYVDTLSRFLTPHVVAICANTIRDHQRLVGWEFAEVYFRQRTWTEHVSPLIEGLVAQTDGEVGCAAVEEVVVPRMPGLEPLEGNEGEVGKVVGLGLWGRVKRLLRRARQKLRIRRYA